MFFGAQDGLLVPLGVVTSVAGAFNNNHIVIVASVAGVFSMGTGVYLASQAEKQVYDAEVAKEKKEIENHPNDERHEMELLFEKEGVERSDAKTIAVLLSKYAKLF